MRSFKIIVTALVISLWGYAQTSQTAAAHVPDQLIVHHRGNPEDPAAANLFFTLHAQVVRTLRPLKLSVVRVAPNQLEAVAQALRSHPLVAEVEYDHYAHVAAVPNDPNYSS